MIGAKLEQHASPSAVSPGLIAAGLTAKAFTGECVLPPGLGWSPDSTFSASLSIVDSSFDGGVSGGTTAAIVSNRSVYLRNVYSRGFDTIASVGGVDLASASAGAWDRVTEYAVSQAPPPFYYSKTGQTFNFSSPVYLHGEEAHAAGSPYLPTPLEHLGQLPTDLQSRHLWDERTFPTFRTVGAVDARLDCGAVGDGETDGGLCSDFVVLFFSSLRC